MPQNDWFVYMLRCERGTLYTGVTTDVTRRLREHRAGGARAARYTRTRGGLELAYALRVGDRSLAQRIEHRLRKLPAARKRTVADQAPPLSVLLQLLDMPAPGGPG